MAGGGLSMACRERPLIFDRKAYDLGFLNGTMRDLLGRRHDKVADTAALQFGRAPHDGKYVRRDPCLDARRSD